MVTRTGWTLTGIGLACLACGPLLGWLAPALVGIGLLAAVALAVLAVAGPSRVRLERSIQPDRVAKGDAAIAYVSATNPGPLPTPPLDAVQPFGDVDVPLPVPRLSPGAHERRVHRLPTSRRGVFEAGPLEVVRADPFGLARRVHRHGRGQRVWVQPRIVRLDPVPAGRTRHLEGPSSDSSPHGTVTFHRLRDYVEGDDLRLVHWPSTARTGRLVVRHHVDTSQPFTVVLLDLSAAAYPDPFHFEEAVDVAASVVRAAAAQGAPVQLRFGDGVQLGGARTKDVTPLVDALTEVATADDDGLPAQLLRLRQLRGGSTLVVVTGRPEPGSVPLVGALRRRFDRVVLASLAGVQGGLAAPAGVRLLAAPDADGLAAAWNASSAPGTQGAWRARPAGADAAPTGLGRAGTR